MSTERMIYGLREKARQVFPEFPEQGTVSTFATHFEREAARRMFAAADALEAAESRLQDAATAWGKVDLVNRELGAVVESIRADRDECLRLLSEERRAKDHADTEAAVARAEAAALRARLEKAREALAPKSGWPPRVPRHDNYCNIYSGSGSACCCGLDDLRAVLEAP